jgi:PIN like domain
LKRPFAASSGSKLPEPLVFFIDRSLGRRIVAQALREVGETVEIHDDHFAPDAKDEVWLVEVGRRGWIVLTKDDRIRYRVTERTALASARVRAFVLTSTQLQGSEMAAAFVKALPRIKRLIASRAPPLLGRVSRNGKVSLL